MLSAELSCGSTDRDLRHMKQALPNPGSVIQRHVTALRQGATRAELDELTIRNVVVCVCVGAADNLAVVENAQGETAQVGQDQWPFVGRQRQEIIHTAFVDAASGGAHRKTVWGPRLESAAAPAPFAADMAR